MAKNANGLKGELKQKIACMEDKTIRDLRRELEQAKQRERAEKIRADEVEELLRQHYASSFKIPAQQIAAKKKPKGSYVRVAFGDTHGASLDFKAWAALLEDMKRLQPDVIVHLGDVLDCGGWLAAHHTTHYVAQTGYSYADEVEAGNQMFDQLQAVCPKATIHVIEGNHDLRVETTILTMTQQHKADSELLLRSVAPKHVLHLERRKIEWWSRGECHHDSVQGGTIKLGKCYFTHPSSSSKRMAAKMVESLGANVVYGHCHRADFFTTSNVKGDQWAAWSPGCLCVKRKYWHHTSDFKHNQGFHVQLVNQDETFLGINVPIHNGKSYLSDLLDR